MRGASDAAIRYLMKHPRSCGIQVQHETHHAPSVLQRAVNPSPRRHSNRHPYHEYAPEPCPQQPGAFSLSQHTLTYSTAQHTQSTHHTQPTRPDRQRHHPYIQQPYRPVPIHTTCRCADNRQQGGGVCHAKGLHVGSWQGCCYITALASSTETRARLLGAPCATPLLAR